MSKTQFNTGDILTPVYMDSIYGSGPSGGHAHDGLDLDGHARKIDIVNETTGTIPYTRVQPILRNYLDGYVMTWNNTSTIYSITFGPGICMDSTNTFSMTSSFNLTKTVTTSGSAYDAWTAGDVAGGVATGMSTTTLTWLHAFIISDGVTVDAGFDSSLTASTLLTDSGYTYYRRVGSILILNVVGVLKIFPFYQFGNDFINRDVNAVLANVALTSWPATATTITNWWSPLGISTKCKFSAHATGSSSTNTYVYIWGGAQGVSYNESGIEMFCAGTGKGTGTGELYTDTAQKIYAIAATTGQTPTLFIVSGGYTDLRGKE